MLTIAAVLAICALVALAAAVLILRSLGSALRLGRLLGGAPLVSIDDALAMAGEPQRRYVRITGRIASDEEFPDDRNRPLVFRRTRLEIRTGDTASDSGWTTVLDEREAVSFAIESRSSSIAVDELALEEGLVVIPRESVGTVGDLPPDLAVGLPDGASASDPARLWVEQLSAVEHATVCGAPTTRDGRALMTSGLGRPLIVTTLDQPAAMRVLAHGHRRRVVAAAAALTGGLGLFAAAVVAALFRL